MNQIRVEFFGLVRRQAGVAEVIIEANDDQLSLGDLLDRLVAQFPALAEHGIDGRRLSSGFTANIDGDRFVSDPEFMLPRGCTLLIMSSDAGG